MSDASKRIYTSIAGGHKELETVRERIHSLHAMEDEILNTPLATEESERKLSAYIEGRSQAVKLNMLVDIFHDRDSDAHDAFLIMERLSPLEFMIALFGADDVKSRMVAMLKAYAPKGCLTNADYHKRLEDVRSKLLDAEVEEERTIRALESVGVEVARRADADPQAVLIPDARTEVTA